MRGVGAPFCLGAPKIGQGLAPASHNALIRRQASPDAFAKLMADLGSQEFNFNQQAGSANMQSSANASYVVSNTAPSSVSYSGEELRSIVTSGVGK